MRSLSEGWRKSKVIQTSVNPYMVSLNTVLKKEELCVTTISCHRDSFHFGLQRNYTPMLHFDFWVSKNPALALTLWQSVGLLRHSQRRRSIPWWTESAAHGFAGTGRMLFAHCSLVFILCVLFACFFSEWITYFHLVLNWHHETVLLAGF